MSAADRPKPLLSVREAAALCGNSTSTAYQWARRGELPGLVRLGGRLYVRRAVLESFLRGDDVPASDGAITVADVGDAVRRLGRP